MKALDQYLRKKKTASRISKLSPADPKATKIKVRFELDKGWGSVKSCINLGNQSTLRTRYTSSALLPIAISSF
jgi:hypothetical protein